MSPRRPSRASRIALGLCLAATPLGCATAPPPAGPTLRALYGIAPVARLDAKKTALVLVDFQEEFFGGGLALAGAEAAAAHAAELLAWARAAGLRVVFVKNVTKPGSKLFAPESPTSAFVPTLAPRNGETVVTKPTGGAFTFSGLDPILRAAGVDTLIVGGLMTHLAVAMTAQDGAVLGYRVVVAADAAATRPLPDALGGDPPIAADALHRAALAALADRFADVRPTASILALPLTR